MVCLASLLLFSSTVCSYSWVARSPGVDSTLLRNGRGAYKKRAEGCPFNANHPGAAPYTDEYPYTGAKNGQPGSQVGGIQVPADGDTAHEFTEPGPNDIRGPCPGLNAAANHNFLSHDGIVTFEELVDTQQNVYNVGYDLAVLLATFGVGLDGDITTRKLSIGCDATERTAALPLLGQQPGLNGHNKFEGDTSLTRNDYFIANGDNFRFNGSLFAEMKAAADSVSGGLFDRESISVYRGQRFDESVATNPNFYFGPKALLLYGAATFLYELFPNYGPEGQPDLAVISSFFGAQADESAPGGWASIPERIPDSWHNRRQPYTLTDVISELFAMYSENPRPFGGNVGVNNFNLLGEFGLIRNGTIPDETTAAQLECLIYQLATENVPSQIGGIGNIPFDILNWFAGQLNPIFENSGCPLKPVSPS